MEARPAFAKSAEVWPTGSVACRGLTGCDGILLLNGVDNILRNQTRWFN
jgi:hypothetical protein